MDLEIIALESLHPRFILFLILLHFLQLVFRSLHNEALDLLFSTSLLLLF